MGAVAVLKKALSLPDGVASFESRLRETESEQTAAEVEKKRAESDLHENEKRGDTKAADSAAAALAGAEERLARLSMRCKAVTSGLADARAAKASTEKAAKVETLKVAQLRAAKDADAAHEKAVKLILSLGDAFKEFLDAAHAENDAINELAREGGNFLARHVGGRGIIRIEEAAKKARSWSERIEVLIPLPR